MREMLADSVFFGAVVTVFAYELGTILSKRFRFALFNPMLLSISAIIALLLIFRIDYEVYFQGAKYISYLLTPTTVCLAIPLYEQMALLRRNFRAICAGILSGVLLSMLTILALAFLFGLDHEIYVTLLPKSITMAIGMGVSEELGGIVTITIAVIAVTGVFGNMIAEPVCRIFRIREPVARGIAIGTASHAIGTARAMEMGEIEGAMSSLSIVVAGIVTVVAASVFAQFL